MSNVTSRRKFIASTAALSSVVYVGCKTAGSKMTTGLANAGESKAQTRVRYNLNDPKHGKNLAIVYGQVVKIMTTAENGQVSRWEQWANIHDEFCPHGNWFFLPWHRAYLYYFEDDIRAFANKILKEDRKVPDEYYTNWTLPYWDWDTVPDFMFTEEGDVKLTPAVDKRTIRKGSTPPASTFAKSKCEKMLDIQNFDKFGSYPSDKLRDGAGGGYGDLEGTPHNIGHGWVGGVMGTFMSPMDPIFWLHHCNVDRYWALWTAKRISEGKSLDESLPAGTTKFPRDMWLNMELGKFLNGDKNDATMLVKDTIDMEKGLTKFTYDDFVKKAEEPAAASLSLATAAPLKTPTIGKVSNRVPTIINVGKLEGKEGFKNEGDYFWGKLSFKTNSLWSSDRVKTFIPGIFEQYKNKTSQTKSLELVITNIHVNMDSKLRGKGLNMKLSWNDLIGNTSGSSVELDPHGFFVDPGTEYNKNTKKYSNHVNHKHGLEIRFDLGGLVEQMNSVEQLYSVLKSVLTVRGSLFQFDESNEYQTITAGVDDNGKLVENGGTITADILSNLVNGLIAHSNAYIVMTEIV